jgi:putative sigma-54 modulation protein
MNNSLQVTFRHMPTSEPLQALAAEKLAKLKQHYPDALDCHVVIDCPNYPHHRKGQEMVVHVELTVARTHSRIVGEARHEDAYAAVRQAFDNIDRQVSSRADRRVG